MRILASATFGWCLLSATALADDDGRTYKAHLTVQRDGVARVKGASSQFYARRTRGSG
jgi:hypothetical protein